MNIYQGVPSWLARCQGRGLLPRSLSLSLSLCLALSWLGRGLDVARNRDALGRPCFKSRFGKSRFPHKSVNLFFILVKDKLTDLWGSLLVQNDLKNTLCEIK